MTKRLRPRTLKILLENPMPVADAAGFLAAVDDVFPSKVVEITVGQKPTEEPVANVAMDVPASNAIAHASHDSELILTPVTPERVFLSFGEKNTRNPFVCRV